MGSRQGSCRYLARLAVGRCWRRHSKSSWGIRENHHTCLESSLNGDPEKFTAAQTQTLEIVQSFRAAPLSTQKIRPPVGQLLRYLALVRI